MAGTVVKESVEAWEKRLSELRPALDEAREIERALEAMRTLNGVRTRSNGSPQKSTSGNRTGRPARVRGGRKGEFLKVVQENPGITVSDAAKKMHVGSNYVYRVAGDLEEAGLVKKDEKTKKYTATEQAAEGASAPEAESPATA